MEKTRARGIKELNRYQLDGERLTLRRAVLAMCAECCGRYADGALDCLIPECPLYPWMPYQKTVSKPSKVCMISKYNTIEKKKELADRLAMGRKQKKESKLT